VEFFFCFVLVEDYECGTVSVGTGNVLEGLATVHARVDMTKGRPGLLDETAE
jgi:hypothetical protein